MEEKNTFMIQRLVRCQFHQKIPTKVGVITVSINEAPPHKFINTNVKKPRITSLI